MMILGLPLLVAAVGFLAWLFGLGYRSNGGVRRIKLPRLGPSWSVQLRNLALAIAAMWAIGHVMADIGYRPCDRSAEDCNASEW